jgi:hypothetical protein
MTSAARSIFSAGVALAGAGVIAVSPVTPVPDAQIRQVHSAAIELAAAPAFGANIYQALVNQFGNFLASYPIVVGSTAQCTVCLSPEGPGDNPITMTGWGAIGIGVGFLNSFMVFGQALGAGESIVQALGWAGLAVQTPITNTLTLTTNDRVPFGGFQLADTLSRAGEAGAIVLNNLYNYAVQAFVTGPVTIIGATIGGLQEFARVLASTGDFLVATAAGWNLIQTGITTARTDLVNMIEDGRTTLYDKLTSGPTVTANPIPTVDGEGSGAAPAAAQPELAAPASAVRNSAKAVPGSAAATANADAGDVAADNDDQKASGAAGSADSAKAGDSQSGRHGIGGSKRARAHAGS